MPSRRSEHGTLAPKAPDPVMRELDLSLRSLRVAVREYRAQLRGETEDEPVPTHRRAGGRARVAPIADVSAKLKTWLSALLGGIAAKVLGMRRR